MADLKPLMPHATAGRVRVLEFREPAFPSRRGFGVSPAALLGIPLLVGAGAAVWAAKRRAA